MANVPTIAQITKTFTFEAAHLLPNVPEGHKCSRLHGHSYTFELIIQGVVDHHLGWVVDFDALDDLVKPVLDALDHYYLNEVFGLANPTSERIAQWIFEKVEGPLMREHEVHLAVRVRETCTSACLYDPYQIVSGSPR